MANGQTSNSGEKPSGNVVSDKPSGEVVGDKRPLEAIGGKPNGANGGQPSGEVSESAKTSTLPASISGSIDTKGMTREDAIKARRIAHGLSPEASHGNGGTPRGRAATSERKADDRKKKVKREHRAKVAKRVVIIVLISIIVIVAVGFWLIRWGLHDDAADIQGQWRVQGTDATIVINDEKIVLNDEVAYDYVIDPSSKTLLFTFGGLSGSGRYRFSLDHDQLAINDGEHDWFSTFVSDVPWTAEALVRSLTGEVAKSPAIGEGDTVLERVE